MWRHLVSASNPRRHISFKPDKRIYTRRMEIGHVEAIFRYPVKSMGGERLEAATLGWHGIDGDRRLAVRRLDDRGGFPG